MDAGELFLGKPRQQGSHEFAAVGAAGRPVAHPAAHIRLGRRTADAFADQIVVNDLAFGENGLHQLFFGGFHHAPFLSALPVLPAKPFIFYQTGTN